MEACAVVRAGVGRTLLVSKPVRAQQGVVAVAVAVAVETAQRLFLCDGNCCLDALVESVTAMALHVITVALHPAAVTIRNAPAVGEEAPLQAAARAHPRRANAQLQTNVHARHI